MRVEKAGATHHNDPDPDAHSADDVQLVVEHLVNGGRAALTEHTMR